MLLEWSRKYIYLAGVLCTPWNSTPTQLMSAPLWQYVYSWLPQMTTVKAVKDKNESAHLCLWYKTWSSAGEKALSNVVSPELVSVVYVVALCNGLLCEHSITLIFQLVSIFMQDTTFAGHTK